MPTGQDSNPLDSLIRCQETGSPATIGKAARNTAIGLESESGSVFLPIDQDCRQFPARTQVPAVTKPGRNTV